MKFQVWIYRKKRWRVRDFGYAYNHALLAYCKKCIKHGSANVRIYRTSSPERVQRITVEPSYGREVLIADELQNCHSSKM